MTMKDDDQEVNLVDEVYTYVTEGNYPARASVNVKRIIRRKSKKFSVKDDELFYLNIKRCHKSSKISY